MKKHISLLLVASLLFPQNSFAQQDFLNFKNVVRFGSVASVAVAGWCIYHYISKNHVQKKRAEQQQLKEERNKQKRKARSKQESGDYDLAQQLHAEEKTREKQAIENGLEGYLRDVLRSFNVDHICNLVILVDEYKQHTFYTSQWDMDFCRERAQQLDPLLQRVRQIEDPDLTELIQRCLDS